MRFRGSIEFWVEVNSLDQVEQAIGAAGQAAHAALGGTAMDDPDSGAMWGSIYEPIGPAPLRTTPGGCLGRWLFDLD
jgi:hypothetical protein